MQDILQSKLRIDNRWQKCFNDPRGRFTLNQCPLDIAAVKSPTKSL
jgi:hypothetical protein